MEKKNRLFENCMGCGACVSECPKACIELRETDYQLQAVCNVEECIGCGICERICPQKLKPRTTVYAAYAKDSEILRHSSSGGIASVLAEYVLASGGCVAGAAFAPDYTVYHVMIEDSSELWRIQGSKYVHSDIGDIYQQVEDKLLREKMVLFSGTPCQIEGLKSYLHVRHINQEYLITQDILCHGVVIPEVWRKYLDEKQQEYGSQIQGISFRDKQYGWYDFGMRIDFSDGKVYYASSKEDTYFQIFLKNLALEKPCYDCNFRGVERSSDITLADFWSVYRNVPEALNAQGTSLCLLHTEKGKQIFEKIKDRIYAKEADMPQVKRYETALFMDVEMPVTRTRFLKNLRRMSLGENLVKNEYIEYGVWGSFNSRCIANNCGHLQYQLSNSSLISLFSEPVSLSYEKGTNPYRNEMLKLDLNKSYLYEMADYLKRIEHLAVDFLEERFGILTYDEKYITDSDALNDAMFDEDGWNHIPMTAPEYMVLWKKACRKFVRIISQKGRHVKIILTKMFLSEKNSDGEYYANAEELVKKNKVLESMYDFFIEEVKEVFPYNQVIVINIPEVLRYTQKNHKYGCKPEHFNRRAELYCRETMRQKILCEEQIL